MSDISLKLYFGNEIRRLRVKDSIGLYTLQQNIEDVVSALKGVKFALHWLDENNAELELYSTHMFQRVVQACSGKLIKVVIKVITSTDPDASKVQCKAEKTELIHQNTVCSECGMSPIVGPRFKCIVRSSFSLCETCEQQNVHIVPLLKIVDPMYDPIELNAKFREECYDLINEIGNNHNEYAGINNEGITPCNKVLQGKIHSQSYHPHRSLPPHHFFKRNNHEEVHPPFHHPPHHRPPHHHPPHHPPCDPPGHHSHHSHLSIFNSQPSIPCASISVQSLSPGQEKVQDNPKVSQKNPLRLPKPALRFIKHVSYPDGISVSKGATFTKTWLIRNDGKSVWPQGVALIPAGGDLMCEEDQSELLPVLGVDEEREISIMLRAPTKNGLYTAYFRAQTKEKQLFGHRLWASIMVENEDD